MMTPRPSGHRHHEVFSAERAGHLDSRWRRFLYRPDRLAERYVNPGDRVLDFGCGPGFFTREFARRVGENGCVIAADLQEEMLSIVRDKLGQEDLLARVTTHRCAPDSLLFGPEHDGTIDIAFAIFVVHEVPDPARLFREISALLVPGGRLFFSDPPFITSGREFENYLGLAADAGLAVAGRSWFFVNRAALLVKNP